MVNYQHSSKMSEEGSGWNIAGENIGRKLNAYHIATTLEGDPAIRDAGDADRAPWGTQGRLFSKIYRGRLVRDGRSADSWLSREHIVIAGFGVLEMDFVTSSLDTNLLAAGDIEKGSS